MSLNMPTVDIPDNRAYPKNTNFETFVPRSLKFHTFVNLYTTKKC